MPIATPEIYAQMLDTAKHRGFAFPAINVTSTQTLNAALKGFADAGSDGIVQISTGGAEYLSGQAVKNMEIGVVGGEEDGVVGEINEKLYTTPEDALATAEAVGLGERGRYILAATFGNVHGVYKPGHVKLRPSVLKDIQEAVGQKYGKVKMNVDTDTQYAFTRPVADHMFRNYDGVLKVDGEVGSKKVYDPRSWGKAGEAGMTARVVHACEDLLSAGHAVS